jgi:GT2 family glycosyltransferase
MSADSLSVVVVNWNSGELLKRCIESVLSADKAGFNFDKLVVVDNGSTDGSVDFIDASLPELELLSNQQNLGFAAACNQGAAQTNSDFLLFLNPDVELSANALSGPINEVRSRKYDHFGIFGIALYDENGLPSTSAARFPSPRVLAGTVLGLSNLNLSAFPAHKLTVDQLNDSRIVDQVIGAYFLVRGPLFRKCNGFDERFFVYYEEVDLSIRIRDLGYRSLVFTQFSAIHTGGGCTQAVKDRRLYYSISSRLKYAEKHYSKREQALIVLLTVVEFPLRVMSGLLHFSLPDIKNTMAGYRMLLQSILLQRRD